MHIRHRWIVGSRFFGGMPAEEIARVVGMSKTV
jgi:hypothetical protein